MIYGELLYLNNRNLICLNTIYYEKGCSVCLNRRWIITSAIQQIDLINANSTKLTSAMKVLEDKSTEIGQITSMIDNNAEQISLNAY